MKKRLFIAIRCDRGIEKEIVPIMKKLKISAGQKELEMRWTPPENFHVTVVFIGESSKEEIPLIEEKMRQVAAHHAPLTLKIAGIGAFPTDQSSRVIWLGVQNSKNLRRLQAELAQEITNRDHQEFSPHLTIGRLRNPHSTKDLISPFVRKSIGKVQVSEIVLYESIAKQAFPTYRPIVSIPLTGEPFLEEEE